MSGVVNMAWGLSLGNSGVRAHSLLTGLLTGNDHNQYAPRMGLVDPAEAVTAFDNASRTFTISPVGASWRLHMYGVEYVKTTESVTITNNEGLWLFYYDANQVLRATQESIDLLTGAYVGWVYWDSTNAQAIYKGYELHGLDYPAAVHRQMHNSIHTTYRTDGGLAVTDITFGNGGANADAQCGISDGTIFDEDIRIHIANAVAPADLFEQILAAPCQLPGFYKSGAGGDWRLKAADTYPCMQASFTGVGTRLSYNDPAGPWDFAEVNNGGHVASWICATNNMNAPVVFICGQRQDNNLNIARQNNTFDGLDLTGLPFQEMVPIARLIFQTSNAHGNAPKARIRDYQDLRGTTNIRGASYVPVNHQSLSGLDQDDHPVHYTGGEDITSETLTANQDDWNPADLQTAGISRVDTDGADYDITGITAPDGTYRTNGKMLIITNVDAAQTITLKNEDAASVAANRMALGADLALAPYQSALIWYDTTSSRWRPLGDGGNLRLHADRHAGAGADPIISLGAHDITGDAELQNGIDLTCAVAGGSDLFSSGTPGGTAYLQQYNANYSASVAAGGYFPQYSGTIGIQITDDAAYYQIGIQAYAWQTVAATKTNTGYLHGSYAQAFRNIISGADDDGTLVALRGQYIQYGHYNLEAGETPQTTNAYGLHIDPYYMSGTIANMYDIYLGAGSSGGTVTNPWGIYQANSRTNYFGGDVQMAAAKSVDCATNGGYLKPRRVSQSAQPTPDTAELLVWRDTDDNKTYLVYEDPDVGTRKVEMT